MTASDFCSWINSEIFPKVQQHHPNVPSKINERIAVHWLHLLYLGLSQQTVKRERIEMGMSEVMLLITERYTLDDSRLFPNHMLPHHFVKIRYRIV